MVPRPLATPIWSKSGHAVNIGLELGSSGPSLVHSGPPLLVVFSVTLRSHIWPIPGQSWSVTGPCWSMLVRFWQTFVASQCWPTLGERCGRTWPSSVCKLGHVGQVLVLISGPDWSMLVRRIRPSIGRAWPEGGPKLDRSRPKVGRHRPPASPKYGQLRRDMAPCGPSESALQDWAGPSQRAQGAFEAPYSELWPKSALF